MPGIVVKNQLAKPIKKCFKFKNVQIDIGI